MKIVVFSDSHNSIFLMKQIVIDENPNVIIHLGDCLKDCDKIDNFSIPIYSVCGNNDFGHFENYEKIIVLANKRIFLTHGHKYNVKNTFLPLIQKAKLLECDILLFGHTHLPYCQKEENLFIMNPGSVKYSSSYGVIIIEKNNINLYTIKKR